VEGQGKEYDLCHLLDPIFTAGYDLSTILVLLRARNMVRIFSLFSNRDQGNVQEKASRRGMPYIRALKPNNYIIQQRNDLRHGPKHSKYQRFVYGVARCSTNEFEPDELSLLRAWYSVPSSSISTDHAINIMTIIMASGTAT